MIEMGLQRKSLISMLATAIFVSAVTALSTAPSNTFVEVRPKLWRYNGEFAFLPSPAARTPVAVWLVEAPSSLILVDTGAASPEYKEPFLKALKRQLDSLSTPLRLVLRKIHTRCAGTAQAETVLHSLHATTLVLAESLCCCSICQDYMPTRSVCTIVSCSDCLLLAVTHGHVDHAGLLPYILDEYPEVSFAVHEAEAPFVTGKQQYQHLKGDTWTFAVGKWYMPAMNASLPIARQIVLKGSTGDLASEVSWLQKGLLTYQHVPGHAPGQVYFVHHSTNSVITGDVITNMATSFPMSRNSSPKCDNPFAAPTHMWSDMKASQNVLARTHGIDTYFPSHDDGAGVTAAELQAFVSSQHDEL